MIAPIKVMSEVFEAVGHVGKVGESEIVRQSKQRAVLSVVTPRAIS